TCFIVLGFIASRLLPIEYFPDLDAPFIYVEIPYPGSTPEENERQITKPAEEVLATISGIKRMNSESHSGGSGIFVEFDWGVDTDVKALEATEKLEGIRRLFPPDLERFHIRKWSTSDMQILTMRISSNKDLANSYDMLDRNIKRRIERIEGVSKVDMYGVEKKEIRIQLSLDRVIEHGVDIGGLAETLRRSNFMVTAGTITADERRLVVRPMGEFASVEEIDGVIVGPNNLRLRDIAEVSFEKPRQTYGRHLDRKYAIGVDAFKEGGANLVDVTERIVAEIDEIRKLPEMEGISIYYMENLADGVKSSLSEVLKSGLLGGCLAMLVLYFFLRRIVTTLVVALAVPVSLLITLAFMHFMGVTLNILSMMGLMLAIGMLVDNAVVVTESIHRHQQIDPRSKTAIGTGVSEVSLAVTAGTMTTAIVFLPNIVSPKDDMSIYLKHVATTICIALGVSLLLAQTIVPLLTSRIRPPRPRAKKTVIDRLIERYAAALGWTMRHRRATAGIMLLVLLSVIAPIRLVKTEMFEEQEDRRIRLHYHINDSYTLEKVEEAVFACENYLFDRQDEFEIESIYSYYQSNYAMSTITLKKGKEAGRKTGEIQEEIRKGLPKLAIADPSFTWHSQGGAESSIRIELVGKSSERLAELSRDVAWTLSRVEGFTDVRSEAETGDKEVQIVVDRQRARQYGFSTQEIAGVISAAVRGVNLRKFHGETGEVDMRLELQDADRQTVDQLRDLPLYNGRGDAVRLESVADFHVRQGPRAIRRENRTTGIGVTANLDGVTSTDARKKIAAVLGDYNFPAGYSWNYGREHRHEQEAMQTMLTNLLLALILIYFVMAALFESLLFPAAIWTQIIFAVVGVYWFFLLTGTKMSIMGMIGILILIGVVVNNGIVLVDHINHLRGQGMKRSEAIVQAGRDRLRPILMTAGTTVLSLVPLCLVTTQIGGAGGPPYFPMARAIVGGLSFSTVITLLALPTIYTLLDDLRAWSRRVTAIAKYRAPAAPRE
ncbi:MAG: efflux RND transporter permease subunit, partial [Candidatus Krumholzibacteria bacterium]|nr:efflux RND transporter permease subunit [Candidatus Krumholzibacteria bacterium]